METSRCWISSVMPFPMIDKVHGVYHLFSVLETVLFHLYWTYKKIPHFRLTHTFSGTTSSPFSQTVIWHYIIDKWLCNRVVTCSGCSTLWSTSSWKRLWPLKAVSGIRTLMNISLWDFCNILYFIFTRFFNSNSWLYLKKKMFFKNFLSKLTSV